MGTFVSTFIPYDATGRAVNLDTEYMYRDDGLKLKVIRFEYYKSDDTDYNWSVLTQEDKLKADNKYNNPDRYKVCDLYIERPSNVYVQNAINDLYNLLSQVYKLDFNLNYGSGERSELCKMIDQAELDLQGIIRKLENHDAE